MEYPPRHSLSLNLTFYSLLTIQTSNLAIKTFLDAVASLVFTHVSNYQTGWLTGLPKFKPSHWMTIV